MNEQTDKCTERYKGTLKNGLEKGERQSDIHSYRKTDWQVDRQTDKQIDMEERGT